MSPYEELSRLLAGDLPPERADELRARMDADPDLRAAWELLRGLPVREAIALAPPPGLDAAILRRRTRRPPVWPWVLAVAAGVLWWARAGEPARVEITGGVTEVDGDVVLLVGDAEFAIDGRATVTVEPAGPGARATALEGGSMVRGTTKVLLAGGLVATVVLAEGEARVVHAAPPAAVVVPGRARARDLAAENAALRKQIADMELEWRGAPIAWPAGLPEALTPAGFERTVRQAVAECAPEVEIVGFECSEPPCLALVRSDVDWWDDLINSCDTWVDAYGSAVATASGDATCADGRRERYQVVGWSPGLADVNPPPPEVLENRGKRFEARTDAIRASWRCRGD